MRVEIRALHCNIAVKLALPWSVAVLVVTLTFGIHCNVAVKLALPWSVAVHVLTLTPGKWQFPDT